MPGTVNDDLDWEESTQGPRHGTVWVGQLGLAVYYEGENGGFHLGSTVEFRSEGLGGQILKELFARFPRARLPRARR